MQLVSLYITSSLSILSAAEAREMKGIIHLLTKNIFFFFYSEISSDLDFTLLPVVEYKLYKHSIFKFESNDQMI